MPAPRVSLSTQVLWPQLLELLGLQAESATLPTAATCPFCRKRLQIFQDYACHSQWFHCRSCRHSGDLIELAAGAWKLPVVEAIGKLRRSGFDVTSDRDSIRGYVTGMINLRRRMENLWQRSRQGMVYDSKVLQGVLHELGLPLTQDDRRNREFDRMVGGIEAGHAEVCFLPYAPHKAIGKPGDERVFKGARWTDTLVFPFRDVPGRVCGFLFVGRNGDPDKDFVYRRVPLYNTPEGEAGLHFHPRALAAAADWGNHVFALDNVITAVNLQIRNFDLSTRPLPIVTWYSGISYRADVDTHDAWKMLGKTRPIFWMPVFSPETIYQAVLSNGWLSTVGPLTPEGLPEYVRGLSATDLLSLIQRHARPWPKILPTILDRLPSSEVERVFLAIEQHGLNYKRVLVHCSKDVQQEMESRFEIKPYDLLQIDGRSVVAHSCSWHTAGRGAQLIVEAILRIEEVIHQKRLRRTYYQGVIRYNEENVPFCVPCTDVDPDPLGWMKDYLITAGKGVLRYSPSWNKLIVQLAQRFHQPRLVTGLDSVGWDDDYECWVLPQFRLFHDGTIEPNTEYVTTPDVPAREISPPSVLSPAEVDYLPRGPNSEPVWLAVSCILANILAPIFHHKPTGIALCGDGVAQAGKKVATALGCVSKVIHNHLDLQRVCSLERTHSWPTVVQDSGELEQTLWLRWINGERDVSHNCVVELDRLTAKLRALCGGWHAIYHEAPIAVTPAMQHALSLLLPAYLNDLVARRFTLSHQNLHTEYVRIIRADLGGYLQRLGRRTDRYPVELDTHNEHGNPANLVDVLWHFMNAQSLVTTMEGFPEQRPHLIRYEDGRIFVPWSSLQRLLQPSGLLLTNLGKITNDLRHIKVLCEDHEDGWMFQGDWLREQLTARQAYKLKIVG